MNTILKEYPGVELLRCADRDHWLRERRNGIGASDAAAILGENPWASPLQVYCDKLGIGEPVEENEKMKWGVRLEPIVAEAYAEETGRELFDLGRFTILRSIERPWLQATLDRPILNDPRGPGDLEIKTTAAHNEGDWEDGAPRHVWVQKQHQLAVTGAAWGSIAVLIGGQKLLWCDVERDDRFIDGMLEQEAEFWKRVVDLDPPQPDASDRTRELLAKLYPADSGAVIPMEGRFIDLDLELLTLKEEIKQAEARKTAIENELKAALGDASTGVLPNGVKFTWKAQTRAEHVVAASTFRVLRRSAK